MKKVFIFFVVLLFPVSVFAFSDTAKSTIVMDMDSGRVLYSKNADERRLIASITKIMTAVVAIENSNVDDIVTVGEEVLSMYGSNIYVELNEKMSLKDLLYGLLLRSGNDAAVVIANYVGKKEEFFVDMMNKKAAEIGMKNTLFKNSHGLDEVTKNYSTARDMALLSSYASKLPLYKEISKTKKWIVESEEKTYVWHNRNKLLYSYKYATGGKTGYTPKAGRTLVTTASKNDLNLTIVTLNDSNEYNTHTSLYEHFFDKYKNYLIVDKSDFQIDQNFFKDELYIKESFTYPLLNSEKEKINVVVNLDKVKNYSNNNVVGKVVVSFKNKKIFETNIYVKTKKNHKESKFIKFIKKLLI